MANLESGSELPNLKIEIENDLEDAMETDDNENKMEYKIIKDDDPEEGELSDSKDVEKNGKVSTYGLNESTNEVTWDREKRYENKGGAFVTGVDIFAKEVQSKLHERAKRFGLDPSDVKAITEHQITELYRSLGMKEKEEEGTEKHFRLNALHMRGTEDLNTQDIFNYFKDYGPASIEWINDYSCNVVWLDNVSAARAMIGLSKHIKGLEEFHSKADPFLREEEKEKGSDKENEKEEIVIVQEIEEPDGDDIIMVMERSRTFISETKPTDKTDDEAEMNVDNDEVHASEITIPIPPGKWRVGVPHPKAKCILLRFTTRADKKQPQAEKMSEYYKKHGNPNYGGIKGIITQSRKRRYQRQDHNSKVFDDDQGDARDFSEPPADGKNPWGNLAKSWSNLDKTRGRRKSEVKTIEPTIPAKPVVPEKQLHSDEQRGKSILRRIGPLASPAVEFESEEDSHTSGESGREPNWTKRSKIPRMRMYADEEEMRLERRKAQVQAQTRKCSRTYREKEYEEKSRGNIRRRRSHRETSRSRHSSIDRKPKIHKDFDRNEDDLRSRLEREGKPRLIGSVVEAASTLWNRLNQNQSDSDDYDDDSDSEKQCTGSESESSEVDHHVADDNLDNYADLRGSLLQGRKKNSQFDDGDLRSKLNFKKTMRQQVPAQKSPLRIEIDNDEYYRLIGSDQE